MRLLFTRRKKKKRGGKRGRGKRGMQTVTYPLQRVNTQVDQG